MLCTLFISVSPFVKGGLKGDLDPIGTEPDELNGSGIEQNEALDRLAN